MVLNKNQIVVLTNWVLLLPLVHAVMLTHVESHLPPCLHNLSRPFANSGEQTLLDANDNIACQNGGLNCN